MKPLPILAVLGILSASAFVFLSKGAGTNEATMKPAAEENASALAPEILASYQPLSMTEIFETPAGPVGLEYSEKTQFLSGKKVQVWGHMVRHAHADPLLFLFAPVPMVLNQSEFGISDDFPPFGLHVITAPPEGKAANFFRGRMLLLGVLETGPRNEVDGRVSHVRLKLDHALDAETNLPISLYASLAMQPERLLNANRSSTGSMPDSFPLSKPLH